MFDNYLCRKTNTEENYFLRENVTVWSNVEHTYYFLSSRSRSGSAEKHPPHIPSMVHIKGSVFLALMQAPTQSTPGREVEVLPLLVPGLKPPLPPCSQHSAGLTWTIFATVKTFFLQFSLEIAARLL